jgi:hypothetical protein
MNAVIKITGDNIKWDENGIETDGQVTLVKYERYVDEIIREMCYEPWMTEKDYDTFVNLAIKQGEIDKNTISNEIENAIQKGHDLDEIVMLVKLLINKLK